MSNNKLRPLLTLVALLGNVFFPALADPTVDQAFSLLDKEAIADWHRNISSNENEERQHGVRIGNTLRNHVEHLSPSQLVELIRRCKQKVHEIPSDSRHERYFDYFEQSMIFSIRRLGEMRTPEAKAAMEQVHQIIKGAESLALVWDQAKAQQDGN